MMDIVGGGGGSVLEGTSVIYILNLRRNQYSIGNSKLQKILILSILRSYPIISHSGHLLGVQYSLINSTLRSLINFSIDIIFNDFILFIVLILFF